MMLEPKFAILDEIDSGLDIDALKVVSKESTKCAVKTLVHSLLRTINVY